MHFSRLFGVCCFASLGALLPLCSASAFWFLPGAGRASHDEARGQVFGQPEADQGPVGEQGAASFDLSALDPDFAPDFSIPTNPSEETGAQIVVQPPLSSDVERDPTAATVAERGGLSDLDFTLALLDQRMATDPATADLAAPGPLASKAADLDLHLPADRFDPTYDLLDAAIQPALATFPIAVYLEVEAGDTLSSLFQDVGISIQETQNAGNALSQVFNLARLRPGQILELELNGAVEPYTVGRLQRVSLAPTTLEQIVVLPKDGGFESRKTEIARNRVLVHAGGPLRTGSVYKDGDTMDIDGSMIANFVNALDAQVDFTRIQSEGDEIEMIYEAYFDDNGRLVDAGNVLYAAFNDRGGQVYEAFRFENNDKAAYFTRDARFTGQTNTLARKPLGGGRLSSRFGMRTHPVNGDRRMHHGVDYAAACGTPIYAAGNGVLTFVGWKGGYGRFIGVKHGPTFTTHYAHLKSFANGMRPGVRVRKGQLIGRVGTTGVSTGCHLHYEVVRNGRKINPLSEHIPRGDDLNNAAKARFLAYVGQIDAERSTGVTIAQAMDLAQAGTYQ